MLLHKVIRGRSAAAIAAAIEDEVHAGRIGPGEALPTVRALSARLRVSPATVAAAYRRLRSRGLVNGAGRGGTHVAPRPPSPAARRAPAVRHGLIDLASGNPDPELLPSLEPALRAVAPDPRLYGAATELRPLINFLTAEFQADGIPARSLALVSGALDGLERVLREHLRAGDAVAVEDPTFPGVLDLLAASGYGCVPVAVDDEGPIPDAFDAALRRTRAAIVTPRAQNPTGAAIGPDRAQQLRRVLRKHPATLLIENDPAGPIAGVPAVSLHDAGLTRWAVVRSTSKFLGPDLRLAAVTGDERTLARVEGRQALGARWVSTILQQIALVLWSDPSSGRLLARSAQIYAQRRNALHSALRAAGITAHGRSGYNVWIPVRHEGSIVEGLAEAGWGVMAGERFRLRSAPAIRVTASSLLPADAERFATDLRVVMQRGSSRVASC